MNFNYQEPAIGAQLHLISGEDQLERHFYRGQNAPLLTIAWNRGERQIVWIDEVAHELDSNQVVLLIYNHSFRFERPVDVTAWRFNRDFYCIIDHDAEVGCAGILFYGMPSPMFLNLDADNTRRLDLIYQVFVDEFGTHDNIQGEMLRMLLKRLIIILTRLAKVQHLNATPVTDEVDIIRQFNLLVEKHYTTKRQVQDYADLLHKSPKTLSNIFGKYSDKTPLRVIRERIATEAKRLLIYTDKTVAEIGYELGFPESTHFSRFFKQVTGSAPGSYRK